MKTNNYQKIVLSLKRLRKGATVADVCAATALPLSTVRELLPKAADEYSGHLQVTQSGEILYTFTHILLEPFTADPVGVIRIVLGIIPFLFSIFFWLIPAVRGFMEKKENENIKLINFKRLAFSKIWSSPLNVELSSLVTSAAECHPKKPAIAGDMVIKELGAISSPEIEIGENGKTFYSFRELEREKRALRQYRDAIDPVRSQLGKTVFDSEK